MATKKGKTSTTEVGITGSLSNDSTTDGKVSTTEIGLNSKLSKSKIGGTSKTDIG